LLASTKPRFDKKSSAHPEIARCLEEQLVFPTETTENSVRLDKATIPVQSLFKGEPMKSVLLAAAAVLIFGAVSYAQDPVKDTEKAAKSTAKATEKAAKKTAEGSEKAADKTADATKTAAKKTAAGTEKAADATVSGTKKAAKKTGEEVKKGTDAVVH
jgi:uncharacterized protein HemX